MSANEKEVTPIFCPYVTLTSQASCISYLDNGVVFIGSSYGDSQLLQLSTTADPESGSHIAELDRWTNLGPIVDFVVTDLHRQGHGQVVTCSGKELDGSLRVVSNGIGMEEQARLELPGVKGMWQIRRPSAATLLVLSFVSETRVLAMAPAEEEGEPDELGEVEAPGLDSDAPSVLCATLCGGAYVVQATPTSLRLIDARSLALVDVWTPPAGASIETCAASTAHILLATAARRCAFWASRRPSGARWVRAPSPTRLRASPSAALCSRRREAPTRWTWTTTLRVPRGERARGARARGAQPGRHRRSLRWACGRISRCSSSLSPLSKWYTPRSWGST